MKSKLRPLFTASILVCAFSMHALSPAQGMKPASNNKTVAIQDEKETQKKVLTGSYVGLIRDTRKPIDSGSYSPLFIN